jgi:arylsulfatase A-like enzyme
MNTIPCSAHLQRLFGLLSCLALVCCERNAAPGSEPGEERPQMSARPNIILLVADDMGYTDIGAFGSEISTPNLDRLAYGGLRLTNFHASPQCAPTRSMLMSGADNHTAGMGSMFGPSIIKGGFGDRPGYERYLHPRVATLPERLGDAGYHTYMAGKWHLGQTDETKPTAKGFDKAFALMIGSASHFEMLGTRGAPYREDGELLDVLPEGFYSTNTYTDKMIEYIADNQGDGKPFFGYLAVTSPHWPMQAPAEFIDRYAGIYDEGYEKLRVRRLARAVELGVVPDVDPEAFTLLGESWDDLSAEEQRYSARTMEIYAAMVENLDFNVGRLLAYLDDIGQLENTLIFFMSDNGAEGDHGERNPNHKRGIDRMNYFDNSYENLGNANSWVFYGPGWAQSSTAAFRLFKGFTTEGGTRVPAFAWHASMTRDEAIDSQYLTLMDVMPTFLDVANAEFDEGMVRGRNVEPMKGHSFQAILDGGNDRVHAADEVIALELHGQRLLVRGDWKIVWEQKPANIWWADGPQDHWRSWRLYNLEDDPAELHDLSAAEPELRDELANLWHEFATENHVMESVTPQWPQPGGQ